jgi:SAM-dependent methyltransferase
MMDLWKFFDVSHRDHLICNPMSEQKLDQLIALLDLDAGARVLDIACGKAELLVRLVERYGVTGDGVDLSPFSVRDARARADARVPGQALVFHEQDGRVFEFAPGSYDLAMCVGASWTFGGHGPTLQALQRAVRPEGLIVVGEPYWRHAPNTEFLAASGHQSTSFDTHAGNVAAGTGLGLTLLYTLVSSEDDWDRYEGLQWRAAERYAKEHPEDPEAATILSRQRTARDIYLRWQRETLGWAIYLFQAPA